MKQQLLLEKKAATCIIRVSNCIYTIMVAGYCDSKNIACSIFS